MDKIILLLIALITCLGCKKESPKQPVKSCDDEMAELDPVYAYTVIQDIYVLETDTLNIDRNSVKINAERIAEKYKILDAIRRSNIPQSDSVFNLYKVAYKNPAELQFVGVLLPDSSAYFTNILLQDIIKKYNLNLYSFEKINPPRISVRLKACPIVNTYALAREIEQATGDIVYSNARMPHIPAGFHYDYNKVNFTTNPIDHSTHVKFNIRYGDCPAGCIYDYTWEFKVNADYTVQHLKSYGGISPR